MSAAGATLAEALGYGIYAVLSSPSFLSRTELGADLKADGPLTPHKLATAISLFLTDGPPDDELLAAVASDTLHTPDQVRAQATRLLATPEARVNLENALIKYFALTRAPAAVLNPEATPSYTVTGGLPSSIFHEGELYMKNLLWSGPLSTLLTSRPSGPTPTSRPRSMGLPRRPLWTPTASVWSRFRTIARACSRCPRSCSPARGRPAGHRSPAGSR